ncbi:MAG: hypothetical protein KME59_21445 [Trichormus sp. ATA11-4-KO1]|jgi:hypothetical protein|nr:hypothetical protein [Trichormus sp. ATA11-4-KO1]
MEEKSYPLVFIACAGFLAWQLWSTSEVLKVTEEKLKVYQQREERTDEVIDKLRGFNVR